MVALRPAIPGVVPTVRRTFPNRPVLSWAWFLSQVRYWRLIPSNLRQSMVGAGLGAGGLSNFWDSGLTLYGLIGETDTLRLLQQPGSLSGDAAQPEHSSRGASASCGSSVSATA